MAWITIANKTGSPRDASSGVTASWRRGNLLKRTGKHSMKMGLYVHKHVSEQLGVEHKAGDKPPRFRVEYDPATNRMRLSRLFDQFGDGFAPSFKEGTFAFYIPLDHVTLDDTRPAKAIPFEVQDGYLIVSLPDWARHRGIEGAAAARDAVLARQGATPKARTA